MTAIRSEEIIREIARSVTARVLGEKASRSAGTNREFVLVAHTGISEPRLLDFLRKQRETTGTLPAIVVAADIREHELARKIQKELGNVEIVEIDSAHPPSPALARDAFLFIAELPWQLAARVVALSADSGPAEFITQALLSGARVIACSDSLRSLAAGNAAGLKAALAELEAKLARLGIELLPWDSFVRVSSRATGAAAPSLESTSSASHPSLHTFSEPEEISEFVEFLERKPCCIEPDKPCIGSARCRTLGF